MMQQQPVLQTIQSQLETLSTRIPIKNAHQVTQMMVFGEKLLLVATSTIQIYSIYNIMNQLPSLIDIVDVQVLLGDQDDRNKSFIKDELTQKITQTQKKDLGSQIFPVELNPDSSILMNPQFFKGRLQYLSGEQIQIGHLCFTTSDHRCFYVYQSCLNKPTSIFQTVKVPSKRMLNIHSILSSKIYAVAFSQLGELFMIGTNKQQKSKSISLHKLSINSDGSVQDNYMIGASKQLKIQQEGLIKLQVSLIQNKTQKVLTYYITIFYINRIFIIQLGKPNQKTKIIPIVNTNLRFNEIKVNICEKMNQQYLDSVWQYSIWQSIPEKQSTREIIYYLGNSSGVWRWNFREYLEEGRQGKEIRLEKCAKSNLAFKTNIVYIDYTGRYSQNFNDQFSLYTETQNGIGLKLLRGNNYQSSQLSSTNSNNKNYKDGDILIYARSRTYIIHKIFQNIKNCELFHHPIDYIDLAYCLVMIPTIKKQILEELTLINKIVKDRSKPHTYIIDHKLMNIIVFNLLTVFESKPALAEKIKNQTITKWVQQNKLENNLGREKEEQKDSQSIFELIKRRCYFSGKKIMTQDTNYCQRCKLYAIKDEIPTDQQFCYICWHRLSQL